MKIQIPFIPWLAGIALVMVVALPLRAADLALDGFKAEIDAVIRGIAPATNRGLEWIGADPLEIRRDGDDLVASITNGRLLLHGDEDIRLAVDRIDIRERPAEGDRSSTDLQILLPNQVLFSEPDGTDTKLTFEDGRVDAVIDAQSGHSRGMAVVIAGVRAAYPKTGASISFGPLNMTSRLIIDPGGQWRAPTEFELKDLEFAFPQGSAVGAIERIAFSGLSAGPKVEEYDRLRDTLALLLRDKETSPDARLARLLAILPTVPSVFGTIRGGAVLEGLSVRDDAGEPLTSLTKAEFATGASGFDGEMAAFRVTIAQEGLKLAPSLADTRLVPHRMIVDFGVENLSTAALNTLLHAAALSGSASGSEQQQTTQQMFGSLAMLNPVGRIYDIAIDARDVGAELTAGSKGTPLSPTGYKADGDLVVRGWDALPDLAVGTPLVEYLPFLKELSEAVEAPDASSRLRFHLASTPEKWATINGNDVSLWFTEDQPSSGQPRLLKPAEPPMQGADVKDVQRALASAKMPVQQDGVYRVSTAAAVARFQKQKGINVSGVVDGPTWQALGLTAPARRPAGRN